MELVILICVLAVAGWAIGRTARAIHTLRQQRRALGDGRGDSRDAGIGGFGGGSTSGDGFSSHHGGDCGGHGHGGGHGGDSGGGHGH